MMRLEFKADPVALPANVRADAENDRPVDQLSEHPELTFSSVRLHDHSVFVGNYAPTSGA